MKFIELLTLFQPAYIGRDVAGLDPGQIHVRHLGVRIEQERRQSILGEIRPLGDFLKRRRVGIGLALPAVTT